MKKEELISLYKELKKPGFGPIDTLYTMMCLENSDGWFGDPVYESDEELWAFSDVVLELWIKQEGDLSIATLSDWVTRYILDFSKAKLLVNSPRTILNYGYSHYYQG